MFLVGLWVGRSGMLRDLTPWLPTLRRVRLWGFAVGLPAAGVQAALMVRGISAGSWLKVIESSAYALGVAPLALAYAATFAILWQSASWRARLTRLAPAGRMALTNYLSQTIVALTAVLRDRVRPDGPRRPYLVAAPGRGRDRGASGYQPMVAGTLRVRPDGMDLAPGDLRTAPSPPQGGSRQLVCYLRTRSALSVLSV